MLPPLAAKNLRQIDLRPAPASLDPGDDVVDLFIGDDDGRHQADTDHIAPRELGFDLFV